MSNLMVLTTLLVSAPPVDATLPARAAEGLRKAVTYFTKEVSTEGGYLWRYSEDLTKREGEGKATASRVWVQPPGTPSVGEAILQAFLATKDRYYLEAARQAGLCLARGQMTSGGWDYHIEFDPRQRQAYAYRLDPASPRQRRRTSTLDDDNTQSAVRFLVQLDEALDFGDTTVHDAVEFALKSLLAAQYPNGAWPQRFEGPPDAGKFPVKAASYPETWSRTYPNEKYGNYYTFNDHVMGDMVRTLLLAEHIYRNARYRAAAERTGDFMILAQMPQPQPGWAQQYNTEIHPAWARKFEPPSITGGESADVVRTLLLLYRTTANKKYLEPLPRAFEYYRRSVLPGNRLARFYELKTNKPLFFTKDYRLTFSDDDMPTHYAFKCGNWVPAMEDEYKRLLALDPEKLRAEAGSRKNKSSLRPGKVTRQMEERVRNVLAALDERGRWIDEGGLHYQGPGDQTRRILSTQTFINNLRVLSTYLAASQVK
jgi:PelA/Pel-15E family pectate lyase